MKFNLALQQQASIKSLHQQKKSQTLWCCLFTFLMCDTALAEGMIEFHPYLQAGMLFDDNIFRFPSKQVANTAGITALGDRIDRIETGADAKLNLGRQQLALAFALADSSYQRYDFLDNLNKNLELDWNWVATSQFYGQLGAQRRESLVGFSETRFLNKVIRTVDEQHASINWTIVPDWTGFVNQGYTQTRHDQSVFSNNDRDDDVFSVGMRYSNAIGSQISLQWTQTDTKFVNRNALNTQLFGDDYLQRAINLNASWSPTHLLKLNTSLSWIDLERDGILNQTVKELNFRVGADYAILPQALINVSTFRELTPIEDLAASYIQNQGYSLTGIWDVSPKIRLKSSYSQYEYDFLGNTGLFNNTQNANRKDDFRAWNLSAVYQVTEQAQFQMQYSNSQRDSTVAVQSYDNQLFDLSLRYTFF